MFSLGRSKPEQVENIVTKSSLQSWANRLYKIQSHVLGTMFF